MRATSEGFVDLHGPDDPAVHSYAAPGVPRLKVRPKPTLFETLRLWLGPVGLLVLNLGMGWLEHRAALWRKRLQI